MKAGSTRAGEGGTGVGTLVGVGGGVSVGIGVSVGAGVGVIVGEGVSVGVGLGVKVAVSVGVGETVGNATRYRTCVGVTVGSSNWLSNSESRAKKLSGVGVAVGRGGRGKNGVAVGMAGETCPASLAVEVGSLMRAASVEAGKGVAAGKGSLGTGAGGKTTKWRGRVAAGSLFPASRSARLEVKLHARLALTKMKRAYGINP